MFPADSENPDSNAAFRQKLAKDKQITHALNRLTFGATDAGVKEVQHRGLEKWIDDQLNPGRIEENPDLESRLQSLETIGLSSAELMRKYPPPQRIAAYATGRLPMPTDPQERQMVERLVERHKQRVQKEADGVPATGGENVETRKELRRMLAGAPGESRRSTLMNANPRMVVAQDLQAAKLYRAIYSKRQLNEILTDFWFNHFNVYLDKGADRFLTTSYEREAIRPHVLGNFRDLLKATAEHPAMLWYLDNWQSVSPNAAPRRRMGQKRSRGLNENYARELLELHTLGVDGGYTQKDIVEIARCFTGWTIREPYNAAEFYFNDRVHDKGEKVVLGTKIPAGGGKEDALKVLDILTKHPSTAKFISRKLAQRFVADDPPESVVVSMAETFRRTEGDIRAVMRTLLQSREFWSEGAYRTKIKSPLELAASAIRATGADVHSPLPMALKIAELGQPLYRKQEPTGYSTTSGEWVNSAGLLGRMNLALAMTQNQLPGVQVPPQAFEGEPMEVARRLLLAEPSAQTREALDQCGFRRQVGAGDGSACSWLPGISETLRQAMRTRRAFLKNSAIAMFGVGAAPAWLARAAGTSAGKRKILVAIFQRGAADGLNCRRPSR